MDALVLVEYCGAKFDIVLLEVYCGIITNGTKSQTEPFGKHSIPSNRDSEKKKKIIFYISGDLNSELLKSGNI